MGFSLLAETFQTIKKEGKSKHSLRSFLKIAGEITEKKAGSSPKGTDTLSRAHLVVDWLQKFFYSHKRKLSRISDRYLLISAFWVMHRPLLAQVITDSQRHKDGVGGGTRKLEP